MRSTQTAQSTARRYTELARSAAEATQADENASSKEFAAAAATLAMLAGRGAPAAAAAAAAAAPAAAHNPRALRDMEEDDDDPFAGLGGKEAKSTSGRLNPGRYRCRGRGRPRR